MRGLFAAGDMMGNISGDIGAAAVYGWIAGHHAADCQSRALPSADPENAGERMAFYSGIYERRGGAAGSSLSPDCVLPLQVIFSGITKPPCFLLMCS